MAEFPRATVTSEIAQKRSIGALAKSLSVLLPGTRLDRVHPDFPQAQLGSGRFEPSYADNATIEGPHRFSVGYWVVGARGRPSIEALVDAWRDWGWVVDDESDGTLGWVRATSLDGYRLVARLNEDENLSLGVSSPSFEFDNDVASTPGMIVWRGSGC